MWAVASKQGAEFRYKHASTASSTYCSNHPEQHMHSGTHNAASASKLQKQKKKMTVILDVTWMHYLTKVQDNPACMATKACRRSHNNLTWLQAQC